MDDISEFFKDLSGLVDELLDDLNDAAREGLDDLRELIDDIIEWIMAFDPVRVKVKMITVILIQMDCDFHCQVIIKVECITLL